MKCCNCGYERPPDVVVKDAGEFWGLSNYFGISGTFCLACYGSVSHDAYGHPMNPKAYANILSRNKEGRSNG